MARQPKALSTLSPKTVTVADNGVDSRRFRRLVAEIGDYSRQCGQALSDNGQTMLSLQLLLINL